MRPPKKALVKQDQERLGVDPERKDNRVHSDSPRESPNHLLFHEPRFGVYIEKSERIGYQENLVIGRKIMHKSKLSARKT